MNKEVVLKNIKERDLKFFKEILEAETIGGKEYLIQDTLIKRLEELGFSIRIDDIGNISAIRGESEKYVLLNAHMDIVNCSYSSYSYSGYSSYGGFNNYNDYYELSCDLYPNDYDFYQRVAETIYYTRSENSSRKSFQKQILEDLDSEIPRLDIGEIEAIGCDCSFCKHSCKCMNICDRFYLDTTNPDKIESFIEGLESYANDAMAEIDSLYYDGGCGIEEEKEPEKEEYKVVIDLVADKIKGKGKPRVLGGDDKCGIFIALKVAELLPNMPLKMLFTVQEETGCVGISHFIDNNIAFFRDVKYSLTIDRRGGDNLLWSQLGKRSCDDEFAAKLSREGVKAGIAVKLMDGSVADVIYIRNIVPNSVNMSAGYYDAHSTSEYIVPSEVDRIIEWVKNIIENV